MQLNTHPVAEEEVMAYLDGELTVKRAQEVSFHLSGCRDCQSLAADLHSIWRVAREWQAPPPTDRLRLPAESYPRREKSAWQKFVGSLQTHRLSWVGGGFVIVALTAGLVMFRPVKEIDRSAAPHVQLEQFAQLQGRQMFLKGAAPEHEQSTASYDIAAPKSPGTLIVRTADLSLTTDRFDPIRVEIERIASARGGYVAILSSTSASGQARSFKATLRVPAAQLDRLLADMRALGHVDAESQGGEDVTRESIDLEARLKNLRETEQRLSTLLRERTGKLADVLAVEQQIDITRGQIEMSEAEQKSLANRVAFATVQVTVAEQYQRRLESDRGITTRFKNAAIAGYQMVVDFFTGVFLFLLSYGPILVVLAALLFWPVRKLWRIRRV